MPLIVYDTDTQNKIAILQNLGSLPFVAQVVAIDWPSPTGTRYYSSLQYDQLNGYNGVYKNPNGGPNQTWGQGVIGSLGIQPVELRKKIINGSTPDYFVPLARRSTNGDDKISLKFQDNDMELTKLFKQHGTDIPIHIYRYYPQGDLLLQHWSGFIDAPRNGGNIEIELGASVGYRAIGGIAPGIIAGISQCQAASYGFLLTTQEDIDSAGCPVNFHIGGSIGIPGFPTCPQLSRSDCIARIGNSLYYIGSDPSIDTHVVTQRGGVGIATTVQGNESRSTLPHPIMLGGEFIAYDLPVIAITPETNTNHPDLAALRTLSHFSIGPIGGITELFVNNTPVQAQNQNIRLGEAGQPPTGYSANVPNYSRIAHGYLVIFGDWRQITPEQVKVRGKFTSGYIRTKVFTGSDTYTLGNSTNRVPNLFTFLTDKLVGQDSENEYVKNDWWECQQKLDEYVTFTDQLGKSRSCQRGRFTQLVEGGDIKKIVREFLSWGSLGMVKFGGKKRLLYIGKEPDLSAVPVFKSYNEGGIRANILRVEGENNRTVVWDPVDPRDLVYKMIVKFFDQQIGYKSRQFSIRNQNFITDFGKKIGGFKVRKNEKQFQAFGITSEDEMVYHAERIYLLGEFDGCDVTGPGLLNNLPINFYTKYTDVLYNAIHEYKVIKVLDERLQEVYPDFQYFRVASIEESSNLQVKLSCIPYVDSFYDRESVTTTPPATGDIYYQSIPGSIPGAVTYLDITPKDDEIIFVPGIA